MENALIILKQILSMFLYMGVGFVLYRTKLITKEGSRSLSNLLIMAVLPCMVVNAFCIACTPEKTSALLLASAAGAASLAISTLMGAALYPKRPMDSFCAAFSNAGFMGIPIIAAVLGSEGVFYIAPLLAILNCLQFTYGRALLAGTRDAVRPAAILKSPVVLACFVGLAVYFTGAGDKIPSVLRTTISTMSELTAPIAMVLLGVYLAEMDLRGLFADRRVYVLSAARLLLIPLVTAAAFLLIPKSGHTIALAVMISSAAPVGANAAIYAQLEGRDYLYACKAVCLSTILSVATMPLMILLAETLWALV